MSSTGKQKPKSKIKWCANQIGTMQRNAAVLSVLCIMMCLTFNYTFPLHRTTEDAVKVYPNQTEHFDIPIHHQSFVDRTKKMASNFENVLRRFKNSTQDFGKNIYDHVSSGIKEHINIISEEDLRKYQQLVIMKKNPYLDLKELDNKFSQPKNLRQNENLERDYRGSDPGIWEPFDEGPNVEITNRGLSGFAIPPELSRHSSNLMETKAKGNDLKVKTDEISAISKPAAVTDVLGSLHKEVKEYVEKKNNK